MKSKLFFSASVLIACFAPTRSKQVAWARTTASLTTNAAGAYRFQDADIRIIPQNENLSCTTLSELSSMKFSARPSPKTDKLDCIDCQLSGTPSEVSCINKDYKRAVPPEWKCSAVFPRPDFRIIGFSLDCDFKDRQKCYEPGICRLTIFVDRSPSQIVRIALVAVIVMTIVAFLLFWVKHCTRKARMPARSRGARTRDLPVRREAAADHLRRGLSGASSPDFHRAVIIPVASPPPSQTSHSHLDDPPPSYEQVVAASR